MQSRLASFSPPYLIIVIENQVYKALQCFLFPKWIYPVEKLCASIKSRRPPSLLYFTIHLPMADNRPTLWICQSDNLAKFPIVIFSILLWLVSLSPVGGVFRPWWWPRAGVGHMFGSREERSAVRTSEEHTTAGCHDLWTPRLLRHVDSLFQPIGEQRKEEWCHLESSQWVIHLFFLHAGWWWQWRGRTQLSTVEQRGLNNGKLLTYMYVS
jgi:hypothetical protein